MKIERVSESSIRCEDGAFPGFQAEAANPSHLIKAARQEPRLVRGFTMIEILVVVAVIAILAGLIASVGGHLSVTARLKRAETELSSVETAIEAYKTAFGFYPHDNPTNTAQSALFYELTGTVMTLDGATPPSPLTYFSPLTGDTLKAADVKNLFGVDGFANTTVDPAQVKNVAPGLQISTQAGGIVTGGIANTLLGAKVPGPVYVITADSQQFIPWNYVATNPTNNSSTYDLWIDVSGGKTTYRVCNWSKEPKPL